MVCKVRHFCSFCLVSFLAYLAWLTAIPWRQLKRMMVFSWDKRCFRKEARGSRARSKNMSASSASPAQPGHSRAPAPHSPALPCPAVGAAQSVPLSGLLTSPASALPQEMSSAGAGAIPVPPAPLPLAGVGEASSGMVPDSHSIISFIKHQWHLVPTDHRISNSFLWKATFFLHLANNASSLNGCQITELSYSKKYWKKTG